MSADINACALTLAPNFFLFIDLHVTQKHFGPLCKVDAMAKLRSDQKKEKGTARDDETNTESELETEDGSPGALTEEVMLESNNQTPATEDGENSAGSGAENSLPSVTVNADVPQEGSGQYACPAPRGPVASELIWNNTNKFVLKFSLSSLFHRKNFSLKANQTNVTEQILRKRQREKQEVLKVRTKAQFSHIQTKSCKIVSFPSASSPLQAFFSHLQEKKTPQHLQENKNPKHLQENNRQLVV